MFRRFEEIENFVLENEIVKKIALACAHDEPALSAVVHAKRKGVVTAVLIGHAKEIEGLLQNYGEDVKDYEIIDTATDEEAAALAVKLVKEGKADIPMKGLMQTSTYLKAILNKETGITKPGNLISHAGIAEYSDRFLIYGDCAVNIAPDKEAKIKIIRNMKPLTEALQNPEPKVAVLSAVEKVSPKIQSTVDAQAIQEEGVDGFVVEGPLALDGAISMESASHKGITSKVAGRADVLIAPSLETGNVLYKSITYIAGKTVASAGLGADYPIILTSRADSPNSKYYSILLAVLMSQQI
ncbi:MAG: hypothetical protein IKF05_02365 [Erysipelotrichaceae bacterium]|nr:hypothetical protein [Erysipelotrichaceae bacterium]